MTRFSPVARAVLSTHSFHTDLFVSRHVQCDGSQAADDEEAVQYVPQQVRLVSQKEEEEFAKLMQACSRTRTRFPPVASNS